MNITNINGCKLKLEGKRAELLSSHHDTEGIAVQRVPDSTDEISLEVQRSMAVEALNRKAALLRQVTEALERIAEGKYGVCLACQEAISPKRLAALPWAALCLECQEATEMERVTDAKPSVGLRPEYRGINPEGYPADSPSGHDYRLRSPEIPRGSRNAGETASEVQF